MAVNVQFGVQETLAQMYARSRELFPTDMSSAEIQQLDQALRLRSVFSARTTNAQYAQAIADITDQLLAGTINEATGRMLLQEMAHLLNYDPAKGFPGDDPTRIPPAEVGSLRDLSSEARTHLVLDTQERVAANYAYQRAGQTDEARYQYPAYELVRIYVRKQERENWVQRFIAAGGQLYDGRMIAPKDSDVWVNLGNGMGGYTDTLGNGFPPFAFGSGMGWREVPRDECITLGVIAPDEVPQITDQGLQTELDINRAQFSDEFLSALEQDLLAA